MEGSNITITRKNGKQLDCNLFLIGNYQSHPQYNAFSLFQEQSHLIDSSYQFEFNFDNDLIRLTKSNLSTILKLTNSNILNLLQLAKDEHQHKVNRYNLTQKQHRLRNSLHKKCQQFQRQITNHADKKHKALAGSLRKNLLFSKVTKIQNIPLITLAQKQFISFQSCQLLIHEKGKQVVKNFLFDAVNPIRVEEIPVYTFNNAFSQIKKSKNRLFQQSQVLVDCPGVLGTFLAKDFDLQNYRILFILSRNDFLPPSIDERDYFDTYSKQLHSVFSRILITEKCIEHINNIKTVLELLPQSITISDPCNTEVFTNSRQGTASRTPEQALPLPKNYSLHTQRNEDAPLNTDAYHLQRVSLLGELLNTLRHELSNPLFGIKLMADLLEDEATNQECKEMLAEISKSCLRCQKIIEDFSYLYQDIDLQCNVDLKKLLIETSTLTKSATRQIRRSIQYNGSDTPINSNPTWISQIVFNLILNSAQALQSNNVKNPEITISATVDQNISISISDNGPGITSTLKKQIFKPFFTTKPKGTGLGLAICSNLARKLGGRISYLNNQDRPGVAFTLWFPNGK